MYFQHVLCNLLRLMKIENIKSLLTLIAYIPQNVQTPLKLCRMVWIWSCFISWDTSIHFCFIHCETPCTFVQRCNKTQLQVTRTTWHIVPNLGKILNFKLIIKKAIRQNNLKYWYWLIKMINLNCNIFFSLVFNTLSISLTNTQTY